MEIHPEIAKELESYFQSEIYDLQVKHDGIRELFQLCESPLESRFLLHILKQEGGNMVKHEGLHLSIDNFAAPWWNGYWLDIYPQYQIEAEQGKKYRADFLFVLKVWDSNDGSPRSWREITRLVVELDGHDFHERTKEQAARDRSRDRFMTTNELPVFRFTGSEIHRNVEECMAEIDKFLAHKMLVDAKVI